MAENKAATAAVFDMTDVKEGSVFNKKRQPEGDYKAQITGVVDAPSKKDGVAQWLFTIKVGAGIYPFYCKHEKNQFWKLRALLVAAGMSVPQKKIKVDPNKLVGKWIAVTLEDDEYDGKAQSNIAATFPVNELNDDNVPDEDDDVEDEDDEEETPPPKKAKAKPEPEEEEDDEEEEEAPAPKKKAKTPPPAEDDDDDDLEEIDIDD